MNQYRMHFKPKGRGNWAERSLLIRATAAPNRGDVMSMTGPDRLRPGKMVTLMMRVTRVEDLGRDAKIEMISCQLN